MARMARRNYFGDIFSIIPKNSARAKRMKVEQEMIRTGVMRDTPIVQEVFRAGTSKDFPNQVNSSLDRARKAKALKEKQRRVQAVDTGMSYDVKRKPTVLMPLERSNPTYEDWMRVSQSQTPLRPTQKTPKGAKLNPEGGYYTDMRRSFDVLTPKELQSTLLRENNFEGARALNSAVFDQQIRERPRYNAFDPEDEPIVVASPIQPRRKQKPFDPEDEPNMVSVRRNVRSTSRTAPNRVRRRTIQDVFSGDNALREMVRGTQYEGLVPAKSQPSPRPTSAPVSPLIRGGRSSAIDAIYENINNSRLNDIIFAKNPEVSPSPYNKTPSTKKPNASGGYDTGRSYNVKTQDELLNYLYNTDSKAYRELTERIRASQRDPRDTGVSYDVPTFNQRIKYLIRAGDFKGAKDLQRQMRLGIRDVSNTRTIDNLRNDIARQGDLPTQSKKSNAIDPEDELQGVDTELLYGPIPTRRYYQDGLQLSNSRFLDPEREIPRYSTSPSSTISAPMTERERRAMRRAEMRASYDVMPDESMNVYRRSNAKKRMTKSSSISKRQAGPKPNKYF